MRREIIIVFARALALGEQRGVNSGQRLGEIEKTDLLSFFGIVSFVGFLREPQTFIHLLTDLIWFSDLFIALSSFLRVQVWQHCQLLNHLLTDFFSSRASLSPQFKFNFLIEPHSKPPPWILFFMAPSSFLWVIVAFTDMFHPSLFFKLLVKIVVCSVCLSWKV